MKKIIRLTESDLHNIVKESVYKIINEQTQDELEREQYQLWKMVKDFLKGKGFESWEETTYNPFMMRVSVRNYNDRNVIYYLLYNYLGIDSEYDLSVKYESNPFGGNERVDIYLPSINKTKFMPNQ